MTPEQLEQAQVYKKEFEDETTTDERRLEILTWVQFRAEEDNSLVICKSCHKQIVALLWHEAVGEGHVYSQAGVREVYITGYCEFCFDKITKDPDDDEDEGPWIVEMN